jgi:hypothetical protein
MFSYVYGDIGFEEERTGSLTAYPWHKADMDTDPDINSEIYPSHGSDKKSLHKEFSPFPQHSFQPKHITKQFFTRKGLDY